MLQSEQITFIFLISVCFFNINSQGYQRFTVTTNYAGCAVLKMLAKDPMECAKLVGVILTHFGQLWAYGQGKPAVIKSQQAWSLCPFQCMALKKECPWETDNSYNYRGYFC